MLKYFIFLGAFLKTIHKYSIVTTLLLSLVSSFWLSIQQVSPPKEYTAPHKAICVKDFRCLNVLLNVVKNKKSDSVVISVITNQDLKKMDTLTFRIDDYYVKVKSTKLNFSQSFGLSMQNYHLKINDLKKIVNSRNVSLTLHTDIDSGDTTNYLVYDDVESDAFLLLNNLNEQMKLVND